MLLLTLVACSDSENLGEDIETGTGIRNGVTITPQSGTVQYNEVQILAPGSVTMTATVTNATDSSGVSWTLDGEGTLTDVTSSSATYVAPTTVTGAVTPLITATSNADTSRSASIVVRANGDPVVTTQQLFPASVGLYYTGSIPLQGGASPFTWTITSGALPDGMTLGTETTTSYVSFSGTPTTAGSYNFQLQVTDTNSRTSTASLTLQVQPATTCLLSGQYAMLVSGVGSSQLATRAASINVASDGSLSGIGDRKAGGVTTDGAALSGNCTIRSSENGGIGNSGELNLNASGDSPVFNFGITIALDRGRVILTNGGTATASGFLERQDPAAFNLAQLAGSYAFGALGASGDEARMGLIGQLTVDAGGVVTAGRMDSNAASALSAATLTGNMSPPDANGRGVLTLSGGGENFSLAYYVINANRLLLINVASEASAPRLTGFMTRRAASFDNTALASPGVLSLWGFNPAQTPGGVAALARLSNGNASAGTVDLLLDSAAYSANSLGTAVSGAQYSVATDGRATLSFSSGGSARQFTLYLDGTANGYVIERGSVSGNAGLLEAQMAGPYAHSVDGLLVLGTQFPQGTAPLVMIPAGTLTSGLYTFTSSGSVSTATSFSISVSTGRGLGTASLPVVGGGTAVLYQLQPAKLLMLRYGSTSANPAMEWLIK